MAYHGKKGSRGKRQNKSRRDDGGLRIAYTIEELIGIRKRKIESVLSGGESVPMEIYDHTTADEDIICDIHVNSDRVQSVIVRISLKEIYGALLEIDSIEELDKFEKDYIKDLYGAGEKIPHVTEMVGLLRIHLAAA